MTRNYEKVFKSANIDTKYIPDAMEAVLKGAVYYRNGYHGGGSVELNSRMFPVALVTFMNPKDINNLFANLYTDIGYCLQNNNSDTNMALLAGVLNGKPAPQSMASSGKLIDVETGLAYSDQNELIEMRSYAKYLAKVAKEVDEEMGTTTTVITSLPHAMQEIDKREARIRELEAAVTRQSHLYSRLNDELNSYRSKVTEAEVAVKKAEEESRTKQAEIDKLKKNLETANANSSNETHWKERYLADRTILQDKFDRLKAVLGNIPRPAKPMFGDPPPKTIKVDDVLEIIGRQ
jgi:RNase H-fold protein (predicted Holliday junction resolvase)